MAPLPSRKFTRRRPSGSEASKSSFIVRKVPIRRNKPTEVVSIAAAPYHARPLWRGGRVVECAGFEIRFTVMP